LVDGPFQLVSPPLPRLRLAEAFWTALTACVLLWIPLTILPIVDGLLVYVPGLDVVRDVGLLMLLAALPALLMALLCALVSGAASRVWPAKAALIAWSVLLLPLLAIGLRQFARLLWLWAQAVSGAGLQLPWTAKPVAAALVLAAASALFWRVGWPRVVAWVLNALQAARRATYVVLLLALGLAVLHPAHFKGMASREPQAAPQATQQPGILVITLDAVAAQDADVCNPASRTMPRLAAFARGATCFARFYTASNFTTATTSTIETGLLPWTHFATQPDSTMSANSRPHSLANVLARAGWRTHSITDNLLASPRHRGTWPNFDTAWISRTGLAITPLRDIATLLPDTTLPRLIPACFAFLGSTGGWASDPADSPYRSEAVYADVDRLLAQERDVRQPQFVWAHTLPPHAPYLPPPSTRHRLLPAGELERWGDLLPDNIDYAPAQQALVDKHRLRYRESLMAADIALGDWLDRFKQSGAMDHYIVVISTDHGESFSAGFLGHAGPRLHEALIRGPLVVRLPAQTQGRVVDEPVSQADLAPTLLDLAGVPALPSADGRSIRALLEGKPLAPVPVFAMSMEHQSRFQPLGSGRFAMIDGNDKLVLRLGSGQAQLFDLAQDPEELHDIADSMPERTRAMRSVIEGGLLRAEQRRGKPLTP